MTEKKKKSRFIKPYSHLKLIHETGSAPLFTPEELFNHANDYFQECIDNPWIKKQFVNSGPNAGKIKDLETETMFTWQGLFVYLGVNPHYINDLENRLNDSKRESNKENNTLYAEIIKYIRGVITMQRFEGAACGAFHPLIVSRLEGLSDKQEINATNTNISVNVQDQGLADKLDQE